MKADGKSSDGGSATGNPGVNERHQIHCCAHFSANNHSSVDNVVGETTTAEFVISDVVSCKLAFWTHLTIDFFHYCTAKCVNDVQAWILKTKTIFKCHGHPKDIRMTLGT